jgi:hypothetical protein
MTLLQLDLNGYYAGHLLSATQRAKMNGYLTANRVLDRYRSREPATVYPFLLSIMLAQVSNHPTVLYLFTREHIPDLLASSTGMQCVT